MKLGRLPALRKDKSLVKKNFPRRVYCAADRNKLSQSFLCYKRKKKKLNILNVQSWVSIRATLFQ